MLSLGFGSAFGICAEAGRSEPQRTQRKRTSHEKAQKAQDKKRESGVHADPLLCFLCLFVAITALCSSLCPLWFIYLSLTMTRRITSPLAILSTTSMPRIT